MTTTTTTQRHETTPEKDAASFLSSRLSCLFLSLSCSLRRGRRRRASFPLSLTRARAGGLTESLAKAPPSE